MGKREIFRNNIYIYSLLIIFSLIFVICFIFLISESYAEGAGGNVYFHNVKNIFVDNSEIPFTTDKIQVDHLVKASNTKDYWERFLPEIRKDYLNSYSTDALNKGLSSNQLTYEEQLRRVIKDNNEVWGNIKKDSMRNQDVLKNILKADNLNLLDVSFGKSKLLDSLFLKNDGKDIFQYGDEKGKFFTTDSKITNLFFDGNNITINKDTSDSITIDAGLFYSKESIIKDETGSGKIEKPFSNIDCSGKNKETKFIRSITDLDVFTTNLGEYVCSDGNLIIYGKSKDNTSSESFFENVPLNSIKQGSSLNNELVILRDNKPIARILTPNVFYTGFKFNPSSISPGILPFFKSLFYEILPFIDAFSLSLSKNSNQYVNIINQDIFLSGEDIFIEIYKPFESLTGGGKALKLLDGKISLEFIERSLYYSRTINRNDFFINKIKNQEDSKNIFQITSPGSNGNYFVDLNKRLSVGNSLVKNPLPGYENVMIPEIRYEMWKRAVNSV